MWEEYLYSTSVILIDVISKEVKKKISKYSALCYANVYNQNPCIVDSLILYYVKYELCTAMY